MTWSLAQYDDLNSVLSIADKVHLNYPEERVIFVERLFLYPQGFYILKIEDQAAGYMISHPFHYKQIPKLNALLSCLPKKTDNYYIHDLALLKPAQGTGQGRRILSMIIEHAMKKNFKTLSLTAVNNSVDFWQKQGFVIIDDPDLKPLLSSYDSEARYMALRL